MNWQKYVKITAAILIIGVIIYVAYLFLRETEVFQSVTTALLGQPQQPTTEITDEKLTVVFSEPVFDYWINKMDKSVYFSDEIGNISKISEGQAENISSQTLIKLNKIVPSFDGTRIFAKFNYPNMPTFSVFDTVTKNWQPLPATTIAAAWAPNSDELMYLDDKSLNITNFTSKKTSKVIDMTQKEVNLDWVSDSTVLISTVGSINTNSSLWSLNLKTKNIIPLIRDEQGLTTKWFQNNNLGIKLHNIKRMPFTSLVDTSGSVLATFNFVTMPSKCTAELTSLYCAVPNNLKSGINLPDDYLKKALYFSDTIYLIDSAADTATILYNPDTIEIDAEHLELFNGSLLFRNRIDGKIYNLKIE